MATYASMVQRGTRAAQPTASSVAVGTLYFVTDELITERSSGSAWQSYSGPNSTAVSGLVLIEEETAAASATLDFKTRNKNGYTGNTFQSDFEEYEVHLVNIVPATDLVDLLLRMSTDAGATFDSGANYSWWYDAFSTAAASWAQSGGTGQTSCKLGNSLNNSANYSINGKLELIKPTGALYKSFTGKTTARAVSNMYQFRQGGLYLSTTAVNAFRLLFSSGNITSGVVRVYGVSK